MKPIIIDMEEMSDSTEVYGSRPSPAFSVLIYALVVILVVVGAWMCLFQIDVVTHADGMIRGNDTTAAITNVTAGRITSWNMEDGVYVSEGDVIFSIDAQELEQQLESCEAELNQINERLEILNAYQLVLDGEEEALELCSDNTYYNEFSARQEAVQISCDTIHSDTSVKESQYQNSLNNIDNSIASAQNDKDKLSQLFIAVKNRSNSFSTEEVYYYAAAEGYINNYNYTASQYDIQIAELQNAVDENGESVDYSNKIEELNNQKAQALKQVESEMIASVEQSIASTQNSLDSLNNSRSETVGNLDSLNNGSEQLSTEQIIVNEKNSVYTEINTYQSKKNEYEDTLTSLQNKIDTCEVKSQCNGYLNLNEDKTVGDYISAGESIGSIVPKNDGLYKVTIYVENQDIAAIKEGQKVKYEIAAYPSTDYGIIEGTVTKISKDIKVNQDTGIGYYEVEATISCQRTNAGENQVEFMQGMALQAKLITEKKSVMRYLLEKIDLFG